MHAGLADQPLDPAAGVDDLLDLGFGLVEGTELARLLVPRVALVEDPGQRDVLAHHGRRERLGDPVAERVGEAEHPAGVLDRGLGLDRAVGDDLRDPVRAPLLGDVPDHIGPATFVEVDVDVGHGHALGIEEALEDEPVGQRVEVGDAHRVGDDRAGGRAAARADRDAVVLRPHDEVRDHQEVGREPHLADDLDLVVGLLTALVVVPVRVAALHALPHLGLEQLVLGVEALGDGEPGHQVDEVEHAAGVDAVRDQQLAVTAAFLPKVAVVDGVHLVGGLDEIAGAVEPEPVRVGQALPGLDAQEHVVGHGVLLTRVMRVVGDHRRDAELLADLGQAVADPALDVDAVVHQLEEVVLLAEDVLPLGGGFERLVDLAEAQPGLQLTRRAPGGGHQPGRVLREDLLVHPRPLGQHALGVGAGRELEQVVQALVVPRPDGLVQVGAARGDVVLLLVRLAPQDPGGVAPGLGRDVGLDADHRRDARVLGLPVELRGPVHVAVVRHRHVRHALVLDLGEQVLQPGGSIEHGVLGVHVQVSERRTGSRHDPPPQCGHAAQRA